MADPGTTSDAHVYLKVNLGRAPQRVVLSHALRTDGALTGGSDGEISQLSLELGGLGYVAGLRRAGSSPRLFERTFAADGGVSLDESIVGTPFGSGWVRVEITLDTGSPRGTPNAARARGWCVARGGAPS